MTDVSEIILWAQQMGFRTVTMDSPLLHKAARRINLAADLQLTCGEGVSVNSLDVVRRVPFVEHHAFMLLRSKWSIYGVRTALIYFIQNGKMPKGQPDGLTRDRGRLVSGRIVVSFPKTAQEDRSPTVTPAPGLSA
ncbi:hypothetical protein [Cupriavidus sp. TMH.W2]|uniref:hypothetical protein n=1 Tax=Cupriavidus sp. TMH.W2 TaxID=3434465 RepID=UPI003D76A4F6